MTAQTDTPVPNSSGNRQARMLKIIAAVILVLGIFGADLVYWLGTRSVDSGNPLPVVGEDKAVTAKVETLVGRQPVLIEELGRNLKQPGTQAAIVVIAGALIAGGCFYVARLMEHPGG